MRGRGEVDSVALLGVAVDPLDESLQPIGRRRRPGLDHRLVSLWEPCSGIIEQLDPLGQGDGTWVVLGPLLEETAEDLVRVTLIRQDRTGGKDIDPIMGDQLHLSCHPSVSSNPVRGHLRVDMDCSGTNVVSHHGHNFHRVAVLDPETAASIGKAAI